MIYNGCIDMEQTAYDGLKSGWAGISSRTQSYCDEVARVTGGSIRYLKAASRWRRRLQMGRQPSNIKWKVLRPTVFAVPMMLAFAPNAMADFIDTTWSVVGFQGEA